MRFARLAGAKSAIGRCAARLRSVAIAASLVGVSVAACGGSSQTNSTDYSAPLPVTASARDPLPAVRQFSATNSPAFGDYLASRHARAQNDVGQAADFLMRVLREDPENIALLQAGLLLQLQDGDFEQAKQLARKLVDRNAGNQVAVLTLVTDAFARHDYAAVKTFLESGPQSGLGSLVSPLLTAWAEAGQNRLEDAQLALEPLGDRKEFKVFQAYHGGLIAGYLARGDLALDYFNQTVVSPGGGSLRIVQIFGQFLEIQGKKNEAIEIYRDFLSRSREHPLITSALERAVSGGTAPVLVDNAAQGAAEVLYGIGSVLSQDDGDGLLPVLYLRLALHLKNDYPVAETLLAGLLEGQGRLQEAIAVYAGVSEDSPLYESAQIQAALGQDQAGDSDKAVQTLRTFIRNDPENSDAIVALADLLRGRERFAEADELYERAIELADPDEPGNWTLYYARGVCLERTGRWADAEANLVTALKLRPKQPLVLNYLGYSWIDQGINLERAREMVEDAARQRPNDGFIIDSLGWAQYRLGNYKQAAETLESAVRLRPQDPVINDHLGDAYWRAGRKLEARFQWHRALTFDPDPASIEIIKRKLEYGPDSVLQQEKVAATGTSES